MAETRKGFVLALLFGLVPLVAAAQPVRSHEHWAVYAQASAEDWQKITGGQDLALNRAMQVWPVPNYGPTQDPEDAKQLTDGHVVVRSDGNLFQDKRAVGWSYQAYVRLVVDLGAVKPVGRVAVRFQTSLDNNAVTPRSIALFLSEDGEHFIPVRSLAQKVHDADNPALTFAPLPASGTTAHAFVLDAGYQARYVRLDITPKDLLVCDQITVLPAQGAVEPLPAPPKSEPDYCDNILDRRNQYQKLIAPGNLIAGKKLRYAPQPNYRLTTDEDDPLDLTDGKLGERPTERIWFEKGAVCWQHSPLVTLFADLETRQPIAEVVIRLLGGGEQGSLLFPNEIGVLLSDDGKDYYLVSARHKRGLDDLSPEAWDLPEQNLAWVHNFRLPVGYTARYLAVQIAHQKQFICADEMAVVKGPANLPAFKPSPDRKVTIVTSGVAFSSHHARHPICANMPLRTKVALLDARSGKDFNKPCDLLLDLPETARFVTEGYTPERVSHEGRDFQRYRIPCNRGKLSDFYLESLLPAGGTDMLFMYGDSGRGPENERRITWESIEIPAARRPKRLHVSLAWSDCAHLYTTWPNFLENFKKLGFNCVGCFPRYWKEQDLAKNQAALQAARDAGFAVIVNESPAGAIEGDRKQSEIRSQLPNGPSGNVCPAYRGQYYLREHQSFAQHAVWCKPDYIFFDIEAYWNGSVEAPRCERCKQRFAEGKFKDWDDFRAAMGRETHVDMKAAIEKALADAGLKSNVTYGSYRTEPITKLNDGLFKWDTLYPDLLQVAMPSLYVAGNAMAVAKNISGNRALMRTNDIIPWLSTGTYGQFDPVRTRDMILEALANGARGITYYYYGDFDPLHFKYHAEAVDIVAPIEDIFVDGAPIQGLASSDPAVKVCGMALGEEMAVLVSRYNPRQRKAKVKVTVPIKTRSPVWDLHARKKIGDISPGEPLEIAVDDIAAHLYCIGNTHANSVPK